ncbi:anthrone oxygenase family protein [Actinacidiphila glaucinigra]
MTFRDAVLVAATVAVGLMAGLFFAFSVAVMPGLAKAADRTLVDAMQRINAAIQNGWFLLVFGGSLLLCAGAVVLRLRDGGRGPLPWVIAATVLYLAVLAVTFGVSIPLNDRLDAAGDPGGLAEDAAGVRERFEAAWVRWNLVRTLLCTGALGCLGWALVLSGRAAAEAAIHTGRM